MQVVNVETRSFDPPLPLTQRAGHALTEAEVLPKQCVHGIQNEIAAQNCPRDHCGI